MPDKEDYSKKLYELELQKREKQREDSISFFNTVKWFAIGLAVIFVGCIVLGLLITMTAHN